nr:uncharacterized protein LOC102148954 [Equus caballus]
MVPREKNHSFKPASSSSKKLQPAFWLCDPHKTFQAAANLGAPARPPPRAPARSAPRPDPSPGGSSSPGRRADSAPGFPRGDAQARPPPRSPSLAALRTEFLRESPTRARSCPLLPAAAARGPLPGRPPPVPALPGDAALQVRPRPHARAPAARERYVLGRRLQRAGRALPRGRLSPDSEVPAPGSPCSGGCGGRDAPAPIEGGREGGGRALPAPPPARARRSFLPASPDGARSAAVAAAAPPGSGARAAAAPPPPRPPSPAPSSPCAPLPSPRAAPSPSPARLRRPHPPRAVTLGDSALATFAAPAPAPARPSDADPGVGRRRAGAGAAAAGARRGLFPPPPPREPEGGPFTRQLGGTKWAPGRGRLPESRSGQGEGAGRRAPGGGGREGTSPGACSPAAE